MALTIGGNTPLGGAQQAGEIGGEDVRTQGKPPVTGSEKPEPPKAPQMRSMGAPAPLTTPRSDKVPDDTAAKLQGLMVTLKDDMLQFSKLFLEIGRELRKFAREERDAATVSQMTALGNAAQEVREAALLRMFAGMVNALGNIASGAINVGGSIQSANVLKGASKPQSDTEIEMTEFGKPPPTPPGKSPTEISNELSPINSGTQGKAQLATGITGIIASGLEYAAGLHDAKKLDFDRQATLDDQVRQRADQAQRDMQDLLRQIMDLLGQVQRGQSETEGKIVVV
jgi:hypothetical protein